MNKGINNANRYTMSHALLGGSLFRHKIIERAKNSIDANPKELGLDFKALLMSCLFFDNLETKFNIIYLGLGILGVAFFAGGAPLLLALTVVLVLAVKFRQCYRERFEFIPLFQRRDFKAEDFIKKYKVNISTNKYPGIPLESSNVCIYRKYLPFDGAGWETNSWSITVDLSRAKEALGSKNELHSFGKFEIYGALEHALLNLGIPNLTVEDQYFVNGADIYAFSEILPNKYAKPKQYFDNADSANYQSKEDGLVRHYKWIKVQDWGSELIYSLFFRFEIQGENLFLEASKFLLTPINDNYRSLDSVSPSTLTNNYTWFLSIPFRALASMIICWYFVLAKIFSGIASTLAVPEKNVINLIKNSSNYNYGAQESFRQSISSANYYHYYQKMDVQMYSKTLERKLIDATADFLNAHNIDVSEIKQQGTTILNSGIFVQGGDVNAQTLAVGKGAQAKSGIFSKSEASTTPA